MKCRPTPDEKMSFLCAHFLPHRFHLGRPLLSFFLKEEQEIPCLVPWHLSVSRWLARLHMYLRVYVCACVSVRACVRAWLWTCLCTCPRASLKARTWFTRLATMFYDVGRCLTKFDFCQTLSKHSFCSRVWWTIFDSFRQPVKHCWIHARALDWG